MSHDAVMDTCYDWVVAALPTLTVATVPQVEVLRDPYADSPRYDAPCAGLAWLSDTPYAEPYDETTDTEAGDPGENLFVRHIYQRRMRTLQVKLYGAGSWGLAARLRSSLMDQPIQEIMHGGDISAAARGEPVMGDTLRDNSWEEITLQDFRVHYVADYATEIAALESATVDTTDVTGA